MDAVGRVADVGELHGHAGSLVALAQADLQLILAAGQTAVQVIDIAERTSTIGIGIAPHTDVVSVGGARSPVGRQSHSGITHGGAVEIIPQVDGLLQRLRRDTVAEQRVVVLRTGQYCAGGIHELDDRVQGGIDEVDIQPNFCLGIGNKAVNIDVGRIVFADLTVNLKSGAAVFIGALVVRSQVADGLSRPRNTVDVDAGRDRLLKFVDDHHVAIVSVLVEQNLAPVSSRWLRAGESQIGVVIQAVGSPRAGRVVDQVDAVAIRIGLWETDCVQAGTHGIVS